MSNLWERRKQQSGNNWLGQSNVPQEQVPIINDQLKRAYQMYQASRDKQGFLKQMAQQNPIFGSLINGGNLKEQFFEECKKRGIDPEQYLSQIQNTLQR